MATCSLEKLIGVMIDVSEKGAQISRAIKIGGSRRMSIGRKEDRQKGSSSKVKDYMTVADILVQKVIFRDLQTMIPGADMGGEEDANASTIDSGDVIEIQDTREKTSKNIVNHIFGDEVLARKLADIIHGNETSSANLLEGEDIVGEISCEDIGFWIDPIDCTQAYIQAKPLELKRGICVSSSLLAVTILIGAYDMRTGEPLAGVVNQPFNEHRSKLGVTTWTGAIYWGVLAREKHFGVSPPSARTVTYRERPVVVHSKHEHKAFLNYMTLCDKLIVPGSGYKAVTIMSGLADVYYLSLATTYKWDTCASSAIALAMGGLVLRADDFEKLDYRKCDDKHLNQGGFVICTSEDIFDKLCAANNISEFLSL